MSPRGPETAAGPAGVSVEPPTPGPGASGTGADHRAPAPALPAVARRPALITGPRYLRVKRVLDLALVVVVLPAALVVMAVVALAILLDDGRPVLYAQERTGRHGRRFRMYKFRTMVRDADALKERLRHLSIVPPPDFKVPDDPRITRVGRFLRATSLDELPQLFNVLRGDMSLVGPRPTSFGAETYDLWHTGRLEVPPGITGLWQIRARHGTALDDRSRLDIAYERSISLGLDLRILAATVASVFRRDGA